MFHVRLTNRDGVLVPVEQLTLTPRWFAAAAVGGPERAEIAVTGALEALWQIVDWTQYGVEIRNDDGALVWWGFVEEATVGMGQLQLGRTLDGMANRVQVAYTYEAAASGEQERGTTAWAQDDASVAAFGRFEETVSLADADPTAAAAKRTTELAQRAWPLPVGELSDQTGGRLVCRGWWATLERQLYGDDRGVEEHRAGVNLEHVIGWQISGTGIGFIDNRVDDLQARLATVVPGNTLRVVDSPLNSGLFMVQSGPDAGTTAISYTSDDIAFDQFDDILDSSGGLLQFKLGYMIQVAGSTQPENNGTFWVTKEGSAAIEVTPGQIVVDYGAGAVTIEQGHGLTVESGDGDNDGEFWLEKAGATITLYHGTGKVAQGFRLASATGWTVREIRVQAMKVGAPADNLRARIYSASGGNPSAVLGEWTMAAANVPAEMGWVSYDLGSGIALNAATDYFLSIDRTGAASHTAFFLVGLETSATYERGSLRVQDGALGTWGARDPDAHMPFRLLGRTETTAQLSEMLNAWQWKTAVRLRTASGVEANPFKDGEQTLRTEVERLLEMGTSAGARLLAAVQADRSVTVATAPASGDHDWRLDREGRLRTAAGQTAGAGVLPAGEWVRVDGAPPGLRDVAAFLVERAEYDVESDRLQMEPSR